MTEHIEKESFGPNEWLVDDMFRRYQENPKAVSEAWRDFFDGYTPHRGSAPAADPAPTQAPPPPPPPAQAGNGAVAQPVRPVTAPPAHAPEEATPMRGVSARIAENMEASLGMPTATSVRSVPAKLLEENRRIINRYLRARGAKVSFTHLIGWAVLKALGSRSGMKVSYALVDGKPHIVEHKHVNFGLAVDVQRKDGRVLMVPNIKNADELDFDGFWSAYEDIIHKVRENKLSPDDFQGTTVTLTNPGTVGTSLSVPRLMPQQGAIIGVGAIAYPPEYKGADPRTLAQLGVSKVITLTSTYDHRVIQGAESGQFLAQVEDLMLGADRFYDEIFASLHIPYEPARWAEDRAIEGVEDQLQKQSRVIQLINMFRVRGHLLAELNPIGWEVLSHPELDLSHYGLSVWDLDREFFTDGLPGSGKQPLRTIVDTLRDAYCRTMGVEYMHISDPDQKDWIQERVEGTTDEQLDKDEKKHILDRLTAAEAFERFLHSKYMGHKRFSLEGAESLIAMLDSLYTQASDAGMVEVVMGMSHRGRLNVLANTVGKALNQIFKEFEGDIDPDTVQGSGDVKYHLGMTGRFKTQKGEELGVVLASNPSHLEAVDPVVIGMTRAKQDLLGDKADEKIMSVLLHGDAAFAGQGVVAETLNMWDLPGYRVGGTVHIVVNNNIGFTTAPAQGRSSTYATDIAKMIQAPIFHVNGDDPEACVRVMRLAFEFRQRFGKDVVVDLVCYRRHGHNEADEPAFTQPLMYAKIEDRRSVRKLYLETLLNRGELTVEEAEKSFEDFRGMLQKSFEQTKEGLSDGPDSFPAPDIATASQDIETGVARDRLEQVHGVITSFPDGFEPHPKLKKMIEKRGEMLAKDAVDWAGGEALAFGSLLLEGINVRLAGQDSRRGTFSQRHSVLIDYRTGEEYVPLNHVGENQAQLRVYDSLLSEFAAMGFEYGYSVANGDALVLWEAQFGDFVNGGQIVIDQFIVAGEDKWNQESGLVLLLPHGYEGQGPEHSSARLERFLTLAAENSIQVAQPTTAAQYFHLLRRQARRTQRKPLIVMTPKSLLRHPAARSAAADFTEGSFRETLDDPFVEDREAVERILFCTGKVGYALMEARKNENAPVAVVRVEQLYPFPRKGLEEIFSRYPNAKELRWVQEEPENMGAWTFIQSRFTDSVPGGRQLQVIARHESASPAAGSQHMHEYEQKNLLKRAIR